MQPDGVDPDRCGVVFGADPIRNTNEDMTSPFRGCIVEGRFHMDRWGPIGMPGTFPLIMLATLPNMLASFISIAHDARGPNNTIHQNDVSSLIAIDEAARVIERGAADVMIAGGASSRWRPYDWARSSVVDSLTRVGDPAAASRPFDVGRSGEVRGEGAAAFVLESRRHAEARGATVLARIAGGASACFPRGNGQAAGGLGRAMTAALTQAGLSAAEIGHVNAHGLSTIDDDRLEAQTLREVIGDTPVTAPKSFFGNLCAAAGAVEMAVSVLALHHGVVPPTLNYEQADPNCPINVIHGEARAGLSPTALVVNHTGMGQAAALVLTA